VARVDDLAGKSWRINGVAAVGIAYLFTVSDLGQDLLRISAERGFSWQNLSSLVGTFLLSLTLWYRVWIVLRAGRPGASHAERHWGRG
jgi:hypothetical protein